MSELTMTREQFTRNILDLLTHNMKAKAAKFLWPWIVQNEQSARIWKAIEENSHLAIMGHGSASKSFTCAQWFLLDWWSAPEETGCIITSDTIDSMKRRIWSDIKLLWSKAAVPMPGILVDSARIIQYSPLDQKNAVAAIAAESDGATSKIQGVHSKRIRVLIDEADNKLSRSVWAALPNLETSGDFKVVALANPMDRWGEFAVHCEPETGWSSLNPEVDFDWKSKRGWFVLRLDGLRSPNIVSGRDDFPFLLTNTALTSIRKNHGEHSPRWWCYIRAFFPPEGTIHNIFTPDITTKASERITWYADAVPCASCDPAFEGGDNCILVRGHFGRLASDSKKTAVQAEEFVRINRKDVNVPVTIDFAHQIIAHLASWGVKPENFAIDSTGNALGLADYIEHKLGSAILKVGFGGKATEMKITQEDSKRASDRFDRFVSELWYVAREWCKLGLASHPNPPHELTHQLESRLYELAPKDIIKIEKKEGMKGRGLLSPDFGDAFCLMVHLARVRAHGFTPGILPQNSNPDPFKRFRKLATAPAISYGIKQADN